MNAPTSGWTGGQYSVYRVLLGTYLAVHFAALVPWGPELFSNAGVLPAGSASPYLYAFPNLLALFDGPGFVRALLVLGAVLAALFALGVKDRWAALLLWYLWACLFGRNPLISNPGLPYVGLLLVVHALLPSAPYGSLDARGRVDPRGDWAMDRRLWSVVWILMAVGYTYSGCTKLVSPSWVDGTAIARVLENPLARTGPLNQLLLALPVPVLKAMTWGALAAELLFAPLALLARARPWLWAGMLAMHLGLILVIDFADLSLGMVMLHLFTFDPSWVRPSRSPDDVREPQRIFYDGTCALCHGFVRFVLAEDANAAFRFATLQGEAFTTAVPEQVRATVPDSVVLLTCSGDLLVRSSAVLHVLEGLGGAWRVAALLLRLVPRPVRDTGYDLVASVRHRLFKKPSDACPMIPRELIDRFEF